MDRELTAKHTRDCRLHLDDILVTGATPEKHLTALEEVLSREEQAGLHFKKKKYEVMVPSITYLGHVIDAEGLHPLVEKVKAVEEAPSHHPREV